MPNNKNKKLSEKIKNTTSLSKDTKELITNTKEALVEFKELINHVKSLVSETDFPELKNIKIPKINLPVSNKLKHSIISYNSSNVNWSKLNDGLIKYNNIMDEVFDVDVSKNELFQKSFNGFYRIRQRPKVFYTAMYEYIETHKHSQVSFEDVLRYFFDKLGRIEASFSSKVAATINPNLPIWDSIILNHLKLKKPGYNLSKDKRLKQTVDLYNSISKFYTDFLKHKLAEKMISDFDNQYPKANISNIKKIDLILWQTRS
jgi:hypothetical protein